MILAWASPFKGMNLRNMNIGDANGNAVKLDKIGELTLSLSWLRTMSMVKHSKMLQKYYGSFFRD